MAILDTTFYQGTDRYSDGDEAENRILEIVKAGKTLNDLKTEEVSWPTLYHLSPVRENICNWYPFRKDGRILEIGAGCGAITGALCRSGAEVCCVDLSLRRSTINYERHKDFENLHLHVGNLNEIVFEEPFDYVIVNGVLEYAGLFTEGEEPFRTFLENIRKYLKADGKLLVAIENRFGLKYFAGAEEDHLGKAYAGIRGYEGEKRIRTFSKSELMQLLTESGFGYTRFYYPYPDYKFPLEIFTDETLKTQHYGKPYQVFDKERIVLFAEEQVASVLAEDGAAAALANSFLVEAGIQKPDENERTLYVKQNNDRREELRTGTRIYEQGGQKKVEKFTLTEAARKHLRTILENEQNLGKTHKVVAGKEVNGRIIYPFVQQHTLDETLKNAINRRDRDGVKTVFESIRKLIATDEKDAEYTSPEFESWFGTEKATQDRMLCTVPANIDLTPDNIFAENGELSVTDCEWVTDFPVPVAFLIWRSLERSYIHFPKLNSVLNKEETYFYFGIHEEDIPAFRAWTWHFENEYVAPRSGTRFGKRVIRTDLDPETAERTVASLQQEINYQKQVIKDREQDLRNREQEIRSKEAHIEQLIESERRLNGEVSIRDGEIRSLNEQLQTVLNSHSWKLMAIPRNAMAKVLPKGGKGRETIKKAVYLVHKPQPVPALPEGTMTVPSEEEKPWETEGVLEIPGSQKPEVSIVIPVYNQFHYTWACLKSIRDNSGKIPYEVIIADDCSTDETAHMEDYVSGVRVIHNKENLRFLRNCNHAAESAQGRYVLFLNNDTQVMENWLEPLVRLIDSDEKIGMVGSKLIYPDGRLQEAGGILWRDGSAWNYGNGKNPEDPEYNYVKEADYISGAAIMIRRELWEKLGGFDERFAPAYCEDSDLAFQVRAEGYKVMYQPMSVVVHFEGVSNGTDLSSGQKAYQVENQKKFLEKWRTVLEAEHEPNAVNVFQARDRSLRKKTMLFVDHYVPMYDKDAGSRTVFAYIRLFVRAGYQVKFIGDNFYRHEPYTTTLQQMGVEVLYGNRYASEWKNWIKENAEHFDYAFLNRPHIAPKYIDIIREKTHAKILYYGHDLHFLRIRREYEVTGEEKLIKESADWQEKEFALMRKADITAYPSEVEIEEIHKIDPSIHAMAIPAYLFDSADKTEYSIHDRKDLFFIGGFTHGPNADAVKWYMEKILPLVREKLPEVRIHIAGSNMPEEIKALENENAVMDGLLTDEQLEEFYHHSRLNVVPLRYGAGIKGKVIESLRYGLPVITTSCGAEGIPGAEEVMKVKDTAEEIAETIISLYQDEKELQHMSEAGKQYVLEHYSEKEAVKVLGSEIDLTRMEA